MTKEDKEQRMKLFGLPWALVAAFVAPLIAGCNKEDKVVKQLGTLYEELEDYQDRYGKRPDSLDDVRFKAPLAARDELPENPLQDPYSGKQFSYDPKTGRISSAGPDEIDSGGLGDDLLPPQIKRKDDKLIFPRIPTYDKLLPYKIRTTRDILRMIQDSIDEYQKNTGKLPESLSDPEFRKRLPPSLSSFPLTDQFSRNKDEYKYKNGNVYSIGPDEIDNKMSPYDPKTKNGDLLPFTMDELREMMKSSIDQIIPKIATNTYDLDSIARITRDVDSYKHV